MLMQLSQIRQQRHFFKAMLMNWKIERYFPKKCVVYSFCLFEFYPNLEKLISLCFHCSLDGAQVLDLVSFWTGSVTIPCNKDSFLVKFDDGEKNLPHSETCFQTLILPLKHVVYEEFKKNMDITLKFGSRGFTFH